MGRGGSGGGGGGGMRGGGSRGGGGGGGGNGGSGGGGGGYSEIGCGGVPLSLLELLDRGHDNLAHAHFVLVLSRALLPGLALGLGGGGGGGGGRASGDGVGGRSHSRRGGWRRLLLLTLLLLPPPLLAPRFPGECGLLIFRHLATHLVRHRHREGAARTNRGPNGFARTATSCYNEGDFGAAVLGGAALQGHPEATAQPSGAVVVRGPDAGVAPQKAGAVLEQ